MRGSSLPLKELVQVPSERDTELLVNLQCGVGPSISVPAFAS